MRFGPTEEQAELVATVRAAVAKRGASVSVRDAVATEAGYDTELWRTLTEQVGVAALAVPEEYGGVGCSYLEAHLVLEELGSALTPSPFVGALLATRALLAATTDGAATDQRPTIGQLLERIANGSSAALARIGPSTTPSARLTDRSVSRAAQPSSAEPEPVTGTADLAIDAAGAEILLVLDGRTLYSVDPGTCTVTSAPSLDPTLRLASITLHGTPATALGAVDPAYVEAVGATLMTALQAGAARRAHALTVAYLKERRQFGRPLGSFQALKHRVADLLVQVETARTMSWAAAWSVATDQPDVRHRAAIAKAWCSDAFSQVAAEMIQLHGGIGITWEHDAHLYFKRAHATAQLFGRPATHRRSVVG